MDIAHLQTQRLEERARSTGEFNDLACFYGAKRDWQGLHKLEEPASQEGRRPSLAFELLTLEDKGGDFSSLVDRVGEEPGAWPVYTLAKAMLARGLVHDAIGLVERRLQARNRDVTVANLLVKHLVNQGERGAALDLANISLQLAPNQRDIEEIRTALDSGREQHFELYLDVFPKPASISFYLPVYNVEEHIAAAIEGLLSQNHPLSEILVVNDGTQDDSMAIARRYPVRIVEHSENRGLAAARNTAIRHSSAEFVGALDSDARPAADYTRNVLMEFENVSARVAGVGGRLLEENVGTAADRWRAQYLSQDWGEVRMYPPPFLYGSNTVFRRDAVLRAGGYDEKYRTNSEDGDLCRKLRAAGLDYLYTPCAVAHHMRRDTAASVLNTRWNWAFWGKQESGLYDDPAALPDHLRQVLTDGAGFMRLDREAQRQELLYIDFLFVFHEILKDVEWCARNQVLPPEETQWIQESLLERVRSLDSRFGSELERKIRRDLETLIRPSVPSNHKPDPGLREGVARFLAEFDAYCREISREVYAVLAA